jgi:hypothetical protein
MPRFFRRPRPSKQEERSAHGDRRGDVADSLPFHFGGYLQGGIGKIAVVAGSISQGILHGIKLALTNPDMAKKTLSRNMRLTDPEALEETYQRSVAVYERLPIVPNEAIETVVKVSTERGSRDPWGVSNISILERSDKEGFMKALYFAK